LDTVIGYVGAILAWVLLSTIVSWIRNAAARKDALETAERALWIKADSGYDLSSNWPELQELFQIASRVLSPEVLHTPPLTIVPPQTGRATDYVKHCVQLALERYKEPPPKIAVRIAPFEGTHAGRVRFERGCWFMDLQQVFAYDNEQLASIVAHEMAHVVLQRRGITLHSVLRNEELTDFIAAAAGFGSIMLAANYRITHKVRGEYLESKGIRLGYLRPSALAMATLLQGEISGTDVRATIPPECRHNVLRFLAKLRTRPLKAARTVAVALACYGCQSSLPVAEVTTLRRRARIKCSACGLPNEFRVASNRTRWTLVLLAVSAILILILVLLRSLP